MEAICGGGLISPARGDRPECRGFEAKRLMGFEPTTFCMAIRPLSKTSGSEYGRLQGFRSGAADGRDQQYARICTDMQRFGNFGAEVPETRGAGLISTRGAATGRRPASAAAVDLVARPIYGAVSPTRPYRSSRRTTSSGCGVETSMTSASLTASSV
jgi:hypothetical protein